MIRQVGRTARIRPLKDDLVIGINDSTKQIVYYSDEPSSAALGLPKAVLEENDSLTLRSDLLDCHVDVCSPEVR